MKIIDSCCQDNKIRRNLRYSTCDGTAWAAMVGLTQDYVPAFALALRATVGQVALLSSIPNLVSAIAQLGTAQLVHTLGSRKQLVLIVVFLQAVLWMPILLIPHFTLDYRVWCLIILFTLSMLCSNLANPAWGSWISQLVPQDSRGRYFGFRTQVLVLTTLAFTVLGGVVLKLFSANVLLGFALLFGGAMLARFISWHFLRKINEPHLPNTQAKFKLSRLLKEARFANLRKYTVFVAGINFATNLAAPFFVVYMLRELGFNYITFMVVIGCATLGNFLSLSFWGSYADRTGNRRVLMLTSWLIPLIPLLWVINHNLYFLIPVQLLSGFAWAGFTLASTNFLYDATPAEERVVCISCFNVANGLALSLGAFIGGYLVTHLPPLHNSSILSLFVLSGILRALVAAVMLRFKEVRHIKETKLGKSTSSKEHIPVEQNLETPILSSVSKLHTFPKNISLAPHTAYDIESSNLERSPPFY
jgi:MFS family permease